MRIFNVLYAILCFFLFQSSSFSKPFVAGDILLAPMKCYLCKLIEGETNSDYSHLFVFIEGSKFAHSLGKVEYIDYSEIKKIVDPSRPMLHVRHKSFRTFSSGKIKRELHLQYLGLPYDKEFLWNNFDESGNEKFYCSEFVLKLLNSSFQLGLTPLPMSYDIYPEAWRSYFGGRPPTGLPGVAPSFFENDKNFEQIKYIYLD